MHFVVCAKQIPDPETPPTAFQVDETKNEVVPAQGIAPVLSPIDAQAAEAALQIGEQNEDTRITVLSLGKESAQQAIKQVLAMGADEGLLLEDDAFEDGDSYTTVRVIATAIEKLGDVDAVFCGRLAADWDFGVVGLGVASTLGWPCSIIAKEASISDGKLTVKRILPDGLETVETELPAVVTISDLFGAPRYPKLKQIMEAARKNVTRWTAEDLGLDPSTVGAAGARLKLERLFMPTVDTKVEIMEGDTVADQAQALAQALRDAKII